MEPKQSERRPRIVPATLAEGGALPVVVVLDAFGDPLACYREHARAAFLLDLLGVVGSAGFCYPGPEGTGDPEVDAVRIERLASDGSGSAESRLETIDRILGGHGVEEVEAGTGEHARRLYYSNAGETYAGTVGLDDSGAFVVTSWGDFVEQAEADAVEQSREEGEPIDRCGYCGVWGDASTRSQCCGGYHADGSPSGFHACEHCGRCSACGAEQVTPDPSPAWDLDDWEPVEVVDRRDSGVESGPEPFDDLRDDDPAEVLAGSLARPCPECMGAGATSRGKCPTCRGFGEVVWYGDGFLARDGLARLY